MQLNNKKKLNDIRTELDAKKVDAEIILKLLDAGINKSFLYENYQDYKSSEGIMSHSKIYLVDYFKKLGKEETHEELRKRYENFSDDVSKAILKDKAKKLMKPIKSNKNKHLISSDGTTDRLFIEFAMLGVDKDFIQKNIAKKINIFNTSDELNKELKKLVESFGSWNIHGQMELLKQQNINIISTKDNKIIFEVNDFKSCHELGSPMWCITREKDTFDDYREDIERIVFCYDLNKSIEDNESKTAYIVNASGHVSSGYYKDDVSMESEKFGIIEDHFDAYAVKDFEERLTQKGYSDEDKYLILLGHGFQDTSDSVDIDDLNYDKFSHDAFHKLISKRNSNALKHIVEINPDLLIHGSRNKGAFLESTINFISESYCPETSGMLSLIIDNEKLLDKAVKLKTIELFQDPLYCFSFYKTENKYELFNSFLEKSKIDIMDILKNSTYFSEESYSILSKLDTNLQERIKIELPEVACKMATSHPIGMGLNYLNVNVSDEKFLTILENRLSDKQFKLDKNQELFLLNKLKQLGIEFKTADPIRNVKDIIIEKPRKISSFREEISTFNISFSYEETKNAMSNLIFEKPFNELSNLHKLDLQEDLEYFKLPKPLSKIVINSKCFNQKAVDDFVEYLGDLVIGAKNEKSALSEGMEKNVNMFKDIRSQDTITGYLKAKDIKEVNKEKEQKKSSNVKKPAS